MPDLTNYEYDIFLSHNHNDQDWTARLAERLEQEDWQGRKLKVFFSPWDIRPGQSIPKEIESGLEKSRKIGLVMSPDAMGSAWVELERLVTTHIAVSARDERLIPLYLHTTEIPALLRPILPIDFRDETAFEESYQTLVAVIRDEPLTRRSRTGSPATLASALIPRPPVVGFVERRDSEGRDIVERLTEELAPEKNQLIALSGPGGVGKTTLAAEATLALSGRFRQRIAWMNALGRDDFALSTLLDEIATQLGQPELRTLAPQQKAEQVQMLVASAPTLIVLDNFETIPVGEQARCVEFLSKRATCPVLITTRLKINSARNVTIPTMSPDEADTFLQLLIDQAAEPLAFAQLERNRIMLASERNPLVMQWVVGQIDLAQEAETVLDDLAHGVGDAAQRVFDRSFELEQLGDDGRAVLLALSLFAPDASRAALAEVAGFGEDVGRLNEATKRLSGLWLVKKAAGSRLTVEALSHQLAKARSVRDGRTEEFAKRFVIHFRSYSEAHAQTTPEDFEALETEKENVLTAIDLAFELRDWAGVMATRSALEEFLDLHGHWEDAIRSGNQALAAADELNSEPGIADFAHNLGMLHQSRGELDDARRLYDRSLEIVKRLGDQSRVANSLHQLATLAQNRGDLEEAGQLYNESLAINKKLGNERGIAGSLHNLAVIAQDHGELDEARRFYRESLEIKKKLGDQSGISVSLHQLASLAQRQGELDEARRLNNESLKIKERLGNQSGIASTLHHLAILAQMQGELDEARRLYNESLEIKKRLGNQSGIANTLHQLAMLAQTQGKLDQARRLYNESLEINKRLGDQGGIAVSLNQLARLAQTRGEIGEARRLYNESLEIKTRLGNQEGIAITLYQLGDLAEDEGNTVEAGHLYSEALTIFERLKSPYAEIAHQSLERVKGKSS